MARRSDRRRRRRTRRIVIGAVAVALVVLGGGTAAVLVLAGGDGRATAGGPAPVPGTTVPPATTVPTTTTTTYPGWVDPRSVGAPYPGATVAGLLTFRGNPTRTWYGAGPVPTAPRVQWRIPGQGMCAESVDGPETSVWCGTGWTGQPAVFERGGRTWLVFGAYDRAVHFVDAVTGEDILPPFPTGDIIKGSVTIDPDGYPIVYAGSRDDYFRAIAIDSPEPRELWRLWAYNGPRTYWNDDWDGTALVLDDHLFEGGENSRFYVVKRNRGYGPDGRVTLAPQVVFDEPGWDDEQLRAWGPSLSIEGSVAISGDTMYFANSGGLVQGWDIGPVRTGTGPPTRTFRFWAGDDTDGTIAVDEDGMLYLGAEWERHTDRSKQVGQLFKLDPSRPDPLVWSHADASIAQAGVYSSAALVGEVALFTTYSGRAVAVDRRTGEIRWEKRLPGPLMGSPVVVDGIWLQGDCSGTLRAFDVRNPTVSPPELWSVRLGGCIESTPAVWKGRVYVGTRGGYMYALSDP